MIDLLKFIVPVLVVVLIFILPKISDRYFKRPNLVMELTHGKSIAHSRMPQGYSSENDPNLPVNRPEAIMFFTYSWNFDLTIINNSEINAYNIVLLQHKKLEKITLDKNPDKNRVLQSHKEETLPFTYQRLRRVERKDISKYSTKTPSEFKDLMFLLVYENQYKKKKFYSRFYFNTGKTEHFKLSKEELENWIEI